MKPGGITILLAGLALAAAAAIPPAGAHGPSHNPSRHQFIMQHGLPDGYRERVNPLPMTSENVASGQRLYNENCVACHGAKGAGNGEGAEQVDPAPASLTGMYDRSMQGMGHAGSGGHLMHGQMHHHPGMTHAEAMGGVNLDAYMFWSVSEGGEPLGSDMPAFEGILSEKERWQILLYIANGFKGDMAQ